VVKMVQSYGRNLSNLIRARNNSSNKALHHYGAQSAPRVNADVVHKG